MNGPRLRPGSRRRRRLSAVCARNHSETTTHLAGTSAWAGQEMLGLADTWSVTSDEERGIPRNASHCKVLGRRPTLIDPQKPQENPTGSDCSSAGVIPARMAVAAAAGSAASTAPTVA